MDRFDEMAVFLAVVDEASFAAAARRLNLSAAGVTRAVAALEERMGTRLLIRTTRTVRLTEAGERYAADCRRILAQLAEAEESAIGSHAPPRGLLSITAPVLFGQMVITPLLTRFLLRHPALRARAEFVDRVINLADDAIDVAIRIGELPDSNLIGVRVGSVRRVVCAAPGYLALHGMPAAPDALEGHRIVMATHVFASHEWRFAGGEPSGLRLRPVLAVTTNQAAIDAAERGWGITRVLSYQIAPQLAAGTLQTVLDEFELPPLPVHVVYQEGRDASARVRSFVDFAVAALREHPALA